MINFEILENNLEELRSRYLLAKPFSYLIIDDFCDEDRLLKAHSIIPELENKSRDYVFANNKFEKSNYKEISPEFHELYHELNSDRMNKILRIITNEDVLVAPKNLGGGHHQRKKNSY